MTQPSINRFRGSYGSSEFLERMICDFCQVIRVLQCTKTRLWFKAVVSCGHSDGWRSHSSCSLIICHSGVVAMNIGKDLKLLYQDVLVFGPAQEEREEQGSGGCVFNFL